MTSLGRSEFPVIALCASLGGVEAVSEVLAHLPDTFPAAVIVAQHRSPSSPSRLAAILGRKTPLPVSSAADGDLLRPGHVLTIPAGKHMLVGVDDRVRLVDVEGVPPARPSADLLLCTLAVAAGQRAVAVILSGTGHDGAVGVQAVHAYGGYVLVQDAGSARAVDMPFAATTLDNPIAALSPPDIAYELQQLAAGVVG
jgi:two-component system, chemotaxis family, protein-glutamate methylesterase/glutaminase